MTSTRLAAVLALGLGLTFAARSAELVTLDGKKTAGTLVAVDPQAVTFLADGSTDATKVPVKQIAVIDLRNKVAAPNKGDKYEEIELTDGSALRIKGAKIKGKAVEPEWRPGPAGMAPPVVNLPLGSVFWLMRDAEDPKARAEWKKQNEAAGIGVY